MIEVLIGMAVAAVLMAVSLPMVKTATRSYHLMAAVPAVTGAIQGTRYQAISSGCPFQVALNSTSTSYQVTQEVLSGTPPACASSFTNVGNAVPWSSSGDVTLSASITLQFNPNGTVANITTPASIPASFNLTNGVQTETITISGVGNVSVSP